MPRNRITLAFADGEYEFALPLPRIDELQRKTGVGIGALFARVMKGCMLVKNENGGEDILFAPATAEFYAIDLIESVRQGLIGGGKGLVNGEEIAVTPAIADRLITNYVLDRPLQDSWSLAGAILGACIMGYQPLKKAEPAKERAPRKPAKKKAGSTTA